MTQENNFEIRVVGRDDNGDVINLPMGYPSLAEMVFHGLSNDICREDLDWFLEVKGEDGQWHVVRSLYSEDLEETQVREEVFLKMGFFSKDNC